jgi:hypothetical protein
MARRKGNYFSGILGPVVLRIRNGEQVASTKIKKGSMKKTTGMKKASTNFGLASKLSGKIKLSFGKNTKGLTDSDHFGRLTGNLVAMLKASQDPDTRLFNFEAQSFDTLIGYNFNIHSPLNKWLLAGPQINFAEGQIQVRWPAMKLPAALRFPAEATHCKLTMAFSYFRLLDGYRLYAPLSNELIFTAEQDVFDPGVSSFAVPEGCLCLLGLFLTYFSGTATYQRELNTEKFSPAGIAATMVMPGEFIDNNEFDWVQIIGLEFPSAVSK